MDNKTACRGGVGSEARKFLNKISYIKTYCAVYHSWLVQARFH